VDFGSAGMMYDPETGKMQFLSSHDFKDIKEYNEEGTEWCAHDYGMQVHGTTKRKPLEVFLLQDKTLPKPLPEEQMERGKGASGPSCRP
jgi:hypothetical protein